MILVVGATRILAPAVETLVGAGSGVIAVARNTSSLDALSARFGGRVVTVAADARSPDAAESLAANDLTAALVYSPAASARLIDLLARRLARSLVEVCTSAAGDPALPFDAGSRQLRHTRLVLGWELTPDGSRWHTPAEISRAALLAFENGHDGVLGVVRPWHTRPR